MDYLNSDYLTAARVARTITESHTFNCLLFSTQLFVHFHDKTSHHLFRTYVLRTRAYYTASTCCMNVEVPATAHRCRSRNRADSWAGTINGFLLFQIIHLHVSTDDLNAPSISLVFILAFRSV
jgi:hypothetical protein